MLSAVIVDIGTWWYVSTFCFLMGLCVGDYEEKFRRIAANRRYLIPLTILTAIIYLLVMGGEVYGVGLSILPITYYITGLTIALVPMFTVVLAGWVSDRSNAPKALMIVGEASYYVYLFQIVVKMWIGRMLSEKYSPAIILVLQVLITILIALAIEGFMKVWRKQKFYI